MNLPRDLTSMDFIALVVSKKVNRSSEIKGISRTDFKTIRDKVFLTLPHS